MVLLLVMQSVLMLIHAAWWLVMVALTICVRCICCCAGAADMAPDSSTTSQDIVMQKQLLHRLQQRGVLGVTLVQWLEQHATRMQLRLQDTAPTLELQGDILDQVYVVEKWCDDIRPLLRLEHSRQVHAAQDSRHVSAPPPC